MAPTPQSAAPKDSHFSQAKILHCSHWSLLPDLLPGPDKWANETAATFQGRRPVTTAMTLGRERL